LNSLRIKIKKWYRGKYIPPPTNDPNSPLVVISPGYYKQPLLAKAIGQIGKFWLNHWQWILGILLTIVGLVVAILMLIK